MVSSTLIPVSLSITHEFSRQASDTISEISEGFRKAEEHYHHVCTMYGENYKTIEPVDFFKKFAAFRAEFQVSCEQNMRLMSVMFIDRCCQSDTEMVSREVDGGEMENRRARRKD